MAYTGALGTISVLIGFFGLVPVVSSSGGAENPLIAAIRVVMLGGLPVLALIQIPTVRGMPRGARGACSGFAAMTVLGAAVTAFTSTGIADYARQVTQAAGQPAAYAVLLAALIRLFQWKPSARRSVVTAWCIGVIAEAVVVAYQLASGSAYDALRGITRASGTMGADFLGVYAVLGVFAGAYLRSSSVDHATRRIGLIAMLAGVFCVIGAVSRGSAVALALAVLVVIARPALDGRAFGRLAGEALAVAAILAAGLYLGRGLWQTRLDSASTASFDRPATWVSGARIAQDHALTGVGPLHVSTVVKSDPRYFDTPFGQSTSNPHNAWLFVADAEGIPYALLLLGITVTLARATRRRRYQGAEIYLLAGLTGAAAVFVINNLFNHPEVMLYVLVALAILLTNEPLDAAAKSFRSTSPEHLGAAPGSRALQTHPEKIPPAQATRNAV
jgi:hypothetical protein